MNTNDFLAANFRDIHSYEDFFTSNRRDFLKRVGGGIVIFMAINEALFGQEEAPRPRGGRGGLPSDFNAYPAHRRGRARDVLTPAKSKWARDRSPRCRRKWPRNWTRRSTWWTS